MKLAAVRTFALSLPDVIEAPHHHFGSFRVGGRIFVTMPPGETHLHVFVSEPHREQALALYPHFAEKLMWGGKVAGLRIALEAADPAVVRGLVRQAWAHQAAKGAKGTNGATAANGAKAAKAAKAAQNASHKPARKPAPG